MANYFNTLNLRQQLAQLGNAASWVAMNSQTKPATSKVKKW